MGLVLDTSVLVEIERRGAAASFAPWTSHGKVYLSAITCSELLVGVHRADTDERRNRRAAFVEALISAFAILDFDLEAARVHALIRAQMPRGVNVDAHDLLIGATALRHQFPVLTSNLVDFARIPGLTVLNFGS